MKDEDYKRAIYGLLDQGFKVKRLRRVLKEMKAELSDAREEAQAAHEMRSHHPYRPGEDGP